MAGIIATTEPVQRHPFRWLAFGLSCTVAAVATAVLLTGGGGGTQTRTPSAAREQIPPSRFEIHAVPEPSRRIDPRTTLYAVSSEAAGRRLERGIAQSSYPELTEGRGMDRYVILVMSDMITFATIESLNLSRMAHGEMPYRVVDARSVGATN